MLESVLSSRRSSPKADDGDGDDESKKKKHFWLPMRITNTVSGSLRAGSVIQCAVISFIMFAVGFLIRDSRNFACVGQREMLPRLAAFENMDGLASDFGALGVPWCRSKEGKKVEWTTKDLLKGLEEFVPIYETRPIKNNMFGMGFDHSFGLWFMARWLKPEIMIESGAFKGHSTWVLRQAMPQTRIISLSPRHPEKYLMKGAAYVDGNCTYFAGKEFLDFGSVNWAQVLKKHGVTNISRALVFFDDHQNELKRLKQALGAGFRHLIFEDNYDTGTGDHYSLRQICDQFYIRGGGHSCFRESDEARIRETRKGMWDKAVNRDELCGEGDAWWGVKGEMRDDFSHKNKVITLDEHYQNSRYVESVLDLYWELPPVAGPALTHQTRYDPARSIDPIIEEGRFGIFQKLGLARLDLSVFNGYTQMVYVQISRQS